MIADAAYRIDRAIDRDSPRVMPGMFAFWFCLYVLIRVLPSASIVFTSLAALYAWKGSREAIMSMTLLAVLILMGESGGAAARWLVVFSAFGRIAYDTIINDAPVPALVWPLSIFAGTILFFAPLSSVLPTVSALKAVSFWMGAVSAVTAFYRTRHMSRYWLSWFLTLALVFAFASLMVVFIGGGYEKTAAGFQGITSHPQTFGPVMGVFAALTTGLLIFNGDRRWYVAAGAVLSWGGIFMSGARTSLLGTVLAFGCAAMIGQLRGYSWWPRVRKVLLHPVAIFVYIGMIGYVAVQWSSIREDLTTFLVKDDGTSQSVVESLQSSRGELIALSLSNFSYRPLTGIGFGVPSDPGDINIQTGFLGLPTGASVEKGFMPSAVLEETGVTGALLVTILMIMLVRPLWRTGNIIHLWMLFVALIINLGEMVFFSIGGMGFFFWLVMSYVHSAALAELEGLPEGGF